MLKSQSKITYRGRWGHHSRTRRSTKFCSSRLPSENSNYKGIHESEFWQTIEKSRKGVSSEVELAFALKKALRELSENDLAEFMKFEYRLTKRLHTEEMMTVATIYNGGECSECQFAEWIHAFLYLGQEAYGVAMRDPQNLLPHLDCGYDIYGFDAKLNLVDVSIDLMEGLNENWQSDHHWSELPEVETSGEKLVSFPGLDASKAELDKYYSDLDQAWKRRYPDLYEKYMHH